MPTRRVALTALITAVAVLLVACGNDPSGVEPTVTTSSTEATAESTPAPTTEPTDTDEGGGDPEDSGQELGSGGGSATITIAGETVEFDSFTCYFGDAAIEEFGADDLTFAALGQIETSEGTRTVAVSSIDSALGPNHTILFRTIGSTDLAWQRVGTDAATIEGDRITGEGHFDKIVDGEHTDETAVGSFEATCG